MSANAPTQTTSLTQDLECPHLSVADVFGLLDDRLTEDARVEIQGHLSNCSSCQALETEIKLIYKTQHKPPTRSQQLLYLKNVLSPLQYLLDEPGYKSDKKFRSKTNKRLSRIENVVKQNQVTVNALEQQPLECDFFDVYHFILLENKKLSQDETEEILEHIVECTPCKLTSKQVKAALNYDSRPTRTQLITYLKCVMDQVTGLNHESQFVFAQKHRRKLKKRLAKAEKRIKYLEQALAQITNNTSPVLSQGGKTYANAN
jgi:hypothetical protein